MMLNKSFTTKHYNALLLIGRQGTIIFEFLSFSVSSVDGFQKADKSFPSFKKEPGDFVSCRDKQHSTGTTPVMSPKVSCSRKYSQTSFSDHLY